MDEKTFAMVCFMTLMDHHGAGYMEAHPSYIEEKRHMLDCGYDAFGYLDIHNMRKVKRYFDLWRIELPEKIAKELRMQEDAEELFANSH